VHFSILLTGEFLSPGKSLFRKADTLADLVPLALGFGPLSEKPSPRTQFSGRNNLIYLGNNYAQFVYYEASPDCATNPDAISITTNRTSNSTGTCRSWPVIDGGDGSSHNITYMLNSGGDKAYASIPLAGGLSQTTYATRLSKPCGEGCGMIYALEASAQTPFFYECNVSVSQVVNGTRPEHELGIDLRNLASTGIALQGYAASSLTTIPMSNFRVILRNQYMALRKMAMPLPWLC
jgi:hypothetical protein